MKLLLDTHAMYWYVEGHPSLSERAKALIQELDNEVFVSSASFWEIAIKTGLGKWVLHRPFEDFINIGLVTYKFELLPILPQHTVRLIGLQQPNTHKDPFDRLLVAQSMNECMPIVSADSKLDIYGVERLW